MDIVIKIFALLGLVAIVAISLYYIAQALQKVQENRTNAKDAAPTWPPYDYMQAVGSVCPTGWAIGEKNEEDGSINCTTSYNVSGNNYEYTDENGLIVYDNTCSNEKSFAPIEDWAKCVNDPSKCEHLKERCAFINNCTYDANSVKGFLDDTRIPWIGVSNLC